MLKEEKELRKFYSVAYPSEAAEIKRDFKQMLTALIRAVREDERGIVERECAKEIAKGMAAAIRGRK